MADRLLADFHGIIVNAGRRDCGVADVAGVLGGGCIHEGKTLGHREEGFQRATKSGFFQEDSVASVAPGLGFMPPAVSGPHLGAADQLM